MEQLVADADVFDIPDEHMAGVLEGLEQAQRGEFASDSDVDAILRKPWR